MKNSFVVDTVRRIFGHNEVAFMADVTVTTKLEFKE